MNIKTGILNVPKHCNKHDLIHFVTVSLLSKDPVLKTCLLYSTLLWCPCLPRIQFLQPVCYIQLLCGVLAYKGSRSQDMSVIFNSCVVSLLTKEPILRICLLYSILLWCPCFITIPFSGPVCHALKYSTLEWCPCF